MAQAYTFRALDNAGTVILQSRGRAGALAKIIAALHEYRSAVAAASGRLYGDPSTLGTYSVDGIAGALGPTDYLGEAGEEIERLDRRGAAGLATVKAA